jgi:hypothetical protein
LVELGLGQDPDAQARSSGGAHGGRQPGDPAAENEQVEVHHTLLVTPGP